MRPIFSNSLVTVATELGTRKISLVDTGNDLAVVLRKLGLNKVDVRGYSFGGGAAASAVQPCPASVGRV